ncbi:MAG: sulfotransferase [Chitinophagales bacterium]|nr:sulfotransferase [Chitinophagales bacterium]
MFNFAQNSDMGLSKAKKNTKLKGHLLYNALPHVWRELRSENKIEGIYKKKAAYISWMVFYVMRPLVFLQNLIFGKRIAAVDLSKQQPIFILGHWRSGTTHLHYLFHKDPQFGTLSNYQSFLFNIAMLSKSWLKFILSPLMPETRPQDNVKVDPDLPAEEEQPLSVMSIRTGFHTWSFPSNRSYFDKYNTFKGISAEEKAAWQKDYHKVLQNITLFNDGKPLVLKNPHNTSRVKELLELYPNAKFIFIHRNPYDVFVSTRHLMFRAVRAQFLEFVSHRDIEDMIFYFFTHTMKKYIAEKDLIPKENLVEVSFDQMEEDSAGQIARMYKELDLPNYDKAKPYFDEYLASVKNYKKNKFRNLRPEILERINREWRFAFEEWSYKIED